MRYIQELGYFEIDCELDMTECIHSSVRLKIIPKKCPKSLSICKSSGPTPSANDFYECPYYIRMRSDTGEPGIFVDNMLYCSCENSIKFIMED